MGRCARRGRAQGALSYAGALFSNAKGATCVAPFAFEKKVVARFGEKRKGISK